MSIFNWFKPVEKTFGEALDIVDKFVVDKDAKIQLEGKLREGELSLMRLKQESYIAELNRVTVPWVDALHKMGRQILSFISLIFSGSIVIYYIKQGHVLDIETMAAILSINGPTGVYNYVKGKGREVKG